MCSIAMGDSMKGIVFDIQNYAIYDGPGIRTTVFLKGCPLSCQWCHNPESWRRRPELAYTLERCTCCGQCIAACPKGALELAGGKVHRDEEKCQSCFTCVASCPSKAREIVGEEQSVDEVVERVLADRPFYENSGGGATFSGGEPTLQRKFLLQAMRRLKKEGIHLALETTGYFKKEVLAELLPLVDLFLFDLKLMDSDRHKAYTGVSSKPIHDNFQAILKRAGPERLIPRMPLITGVNCDTKDIEAVIDFLKAAGYHGQVDLMPYNRMARDKWEKTGRGGLYRDWGALGEETLNGIIEQLEGAGFQVMVNR